MDGLKDVQRTTTKGDKKINWTEEKCTKTKKKHTHRYTHLYSSAKIVTAWTELTQGNAKHSNNTYCILQPLQRDYTESPLEWRVFVCC